MPILDGTWEIRREGSSSWQPVRVPGCWEEAGIPKTDSGPFWYRTIFYIPEQVIGKRIWLRFGAVSYACRVLINGQFAGEHTGMWDAFSIEITPFIQPRKPTELLVEVEKPSSLTSGPDSAYESGNYPLRATLSGFLPYVWGHAFGGIWQDVELYTTGSRIITDARIHGFPGGQAHVSISVSAPGPAQIIIVDPAGSTVWDQTLHSDQTSEYRLQIPNPVPWSLTDPAIYTAKISLADGDERCLRFGLHTFDIEGRNITLNGRPIYPRMILSWGWYPDRLHPNPGIEKVRQDMLRLHALGYNGIKLCLWFPPSYYYDLADELGMLIWVELPMWLPTPKEGYHDQILREYDRLVRLARQHPSVGMYTLGCELSQAVDEGLLAQLYTQTKELSNGALVRDNSGSGEAYSGFLHEHADFDDNHLYCELQFLGPLLDAFAPTWRDARPWLMGEFCDYDTFPTLSDSWWSNPDPAINPQGARWEMRVVHHTERLRKNGMDGCLRELLLASYRQALVHRKYTIETIRSRVDSSGYVITGEVDTPVSTAGMWGASGKDKFDPEEFNQFNRDFVLALGWDRRRAWVAGGDRPSPQDRYNHVSGSLVRIHLVGSNYSRQQNAIRVNWDIGFPGQESFASGEASLKDVLFPGKVQSLEVIEFTAPLVSSPRQAILRAQVTQEETLTSNTWPIWFYPPDGWVTVPRFGLFDPHNILSDLPKLSGGKCVPGIDGLSVLVCSAWSGEVDAFVKQGGKAILLADLNSLPGPLPVVPAPYWREALKLVEDHPSWGDFPHGNAPDLQFYTLAPDCALDASGFQGNIRPIYRRLDMRGLELHEYAIELHWGQGRIIMTTLRFSGGLGDQPAGLRYCLAGQHLLANWVRSLHL